MVSLLCLLLAAAPDDLSPEKAAVIEREQAKATSAVAEKYGNKKPNELSRDERSQMIRDQAKAEKQVLEKNGVEAKAWARYGAKQSREDLAKTKAATKALDAKEKADEEAAKHVAAPPKTADEVGVQRGGNEENPVVLEENENSTPTVETSLPADYQADQAAAAGTEAPGAPAPAKAPAKGATGKHSSKR